jgi:hypothetical protein
VNAVSECNDCHTFPLYVPGGDPFQGQPEQINTQNYLAGGAPFFGPFVPRNLTPDASGKPAGLTLHEFIHIMRTGEDDEPPVLPDGSDTLLQVMPWPTFRRCQITISVPSTSSSARFPTRSRRRPCRSRSTLPLFAHASDRRHAPMKGTP